MGRPTAREREGANHIRPMMPVRRSVCRSPTRDERGRGVNCSRGITPPQRRRSHFHTHSARRPRHVLLVLVLSGLVLCFCSILCRFAPSRSRSPRCWRSPRSIASRARPLFADGIVQNYYNVRGTGPSPQVVNVWPRAPEGDQEESSRSHGAHVIPPKGRVQRPGTAAVSVGCVRPARSLHHCVAVDFFFDCGTFVFRAPQPLASPRGPWRE